MKIYLYKLINKKIKSEKSYLLAFSSSEQQRNLWWVNESVEVYPCLRGNSYPGYIHVAVQKVQFGLQGQNQTVKAITMEQ